MNNLGWRNKSEDWGRTYQGSESFSVLRGFSSPATKHLTIALLPIGLSPSLSSRNP